MMPRFLVPTTIATAAIVASCSSSGAASPPIEPIEGILAGAIELAPDPSGTSATLNVSTEIAVACAVIYGTDDSYGQIAVDADMQGGGHEDHGPLLSGLLPDTQYQYILQGSDAAGTIYRSEIGTFRTPIAAESEFGTNIATFATVIGVSSEFSPSFSASNAIDNDIGTEWSTKGDGDEAWIELDLGESRTIGAVAFRTRQMGDGTAITQEFMVTVDGSAAGPFATGADPAELVEPLTGRFVRFDATTTTGGNTGAVEIQIYAEG